MKRLKQRVCPFGTWSFRAHLRETMPTRARAATSGVGVGVGEWCVDAGAALGWARFLLDQATRVRVARKCELTRTVYIGVDNRF